MGIEKFIHKSMVKYTLKLALLFVLIMFTFTISSCSLFASKPDIKEPDVVDPNPSPNPKPEPDPNPSPDPKPDPSPNPNPSPDPEPDPTPTPNPEGLTYLDLFDIQNTIQIDIHVDDNELQKLNSDYDKYRAKGLKSPIYRCAKKVTILIVKNGQNYTYNFDDVGIRMKGNTSRKNFIDQNNNIYETIHLKLSFEETFDDPMYYTASERKTWTSEAKQAREDRKFLDMSKLDLRYNRLQDQSHIKEYYALEMYRDFGIMAQHSNFGSVIIHQNNKTVNYGLFLVTEALTKTFIKRSLENEEYINMGTWNAEKKGKIGVTDSKYGQLYKASYGLGRRVMAPSMTSWDDDLFGAEPDDASYTPPYELKSNQSTNDNQMIKKMIKTLNEGSIEEIEKLIDLEYFITYEAISTLLGDPDDLRNNYNNYAMYFRRTDGKMVLIPIDLDRVLGVAREFDPSGTAMTDVSPLSKKAVGTNQDQINPLYNKIILGSEKYQKAYLDKLEEIMASKWFKEEYFNSIYGLIKSHYQNVKDDLHSIPWDLNEHYSPSNSNMSFSEYVTKKMVTINMVLHQEDQTNVVLNYTNFYLTGTMDNWNKTTQEYKFSKIGENEYKVEYIIKEGHFECKIYTTDDNGKWLRADNDEVLHEHGDNIIFDFDKEDSGKILVFTIDTATGVIHYEIEDSKDVLFN